LAGQSAFDVGDQSLFGVEGEDAVVSHVIAREPLSDRSNLLIDTKIASSG